MNNFYGFALYAPSVGKVINSECGTRKKAETLLSDRQANGEAFEGEYIFQETPPPHGCVSNLATDPNGAYCSVCGVTLC